MIKKTTILCLAIAGIAGTAVAQTGAFSKLPSGLQYRIVKHGAGTMKPKLGDYMEFHIKSFVHFDKADSVLFDSRKMNGNQPVPFQLQAPAFKGDLSEGFMLLSEGDSAQFRVPVDSVLKAGNQLLPWMAKGKNMMIEYNVAVTKVRSQAQMQEEQKAAAAKQVAVDDAMLTAYFTKNGIKATKTPSGLYYSVQQMGKGPKPVMGDSVSMNYTGMLLSGDKFDSNIEPEFQHVQPFWFMLGMHQVISGWDEGIALMPKGSKGTLYIPSRMAYGAQSPSPKIPANSPLVFNVEVVDVKAKKK